MCHQQPSATCPSGNSWHRRCFPAACKKIMTRAYCARSCISLFIKMLSVRPLKAGSRHKSSKLQACSSKIWHTSRTCATASEYGNPIPLTDEYGHIIQQTDEFGNPVGQTVRPSGYGTALTGYGVEVGGGNQREPHKEHHTLGSMLHRTGSSSSSSSVGSYQLILCACYFSKDTSL